MNAAFPKLTASSLVFHQCLIWPISFVPAEQRLLHQPHAISSWPHRSCMLRTSVTADSLLQSLGCWLPSPLPDSDVMKLRGHIITLGISSFRLIPSLWGFTWWGWAPSKHPLLKRESRNARGQAFVPLRLSLTILAPKWYLGASLDWDEILWLQTQHSFQLNICVLLVSFWIVYFPAMFFSLLHSSGPWYKLFLLLFIPGPFQHRGPFHWATAEQELCWNRRLGKGRYLHHKTTRSISPSGNSKRSWLHRWRAGEKIKAGPKFTFQTDTTQGKSGRAGGW